MTIVNDFEMNANFHLCLGVIDGKYIRIKKPKNRDSMFLNYKHYFSIVIITVVDTNYYFITIDVGTYGKECDSATLSETEFWKIFVGNKLNIS